MVRVGLVALAGVMALMTGCSDSDHGAPVGQDPGATTVVTAPGLTASGESMVFSDSGTPVDVMAGESFAIRLAANPSTGYVWSVDGSPDPAVVNLLDAGGTYLPPDQQRPGALGFQLFGFAAVAPGTTQVQFTYARPFDPTDNPTIDTFTIRVG